MTSIVIHPSIDNSIRQHVYDWCETQFGEMHDSTNLENRIWIITSNYKRTPIGTFDVIFNTHLFATLFRMRWGGVVV